MVSYKALNTNFVFVFGARSGGSWVCCLAALKLIVFYWKILYRDPKSQMNIDPPVAL